MWSKGKHQIHKAIQIIDRMKWSDCVVDWDLGRVGQGTQARGIRSRTLMGSFSRSLGNGRPQTLSCYTVISFSWFFFYLFFAHSCVKRVWKCTLQLLRNNLLSRENTSQHFHILLSVSIRVLNVKRRHRLFPSFVMCQSWRNHSWPLVASRSAILVFWI